MTKPRFIDCQTFAGGFSLGAVQAGFELVAKRENVGGFGAPAMEGNRHLLGDAWQLEAVEPRDWSPASAEALFANPPCSGFSLRSIHVPPKGTDRKKVPVSEWANSFRGADSAINSCMWDAVEYGARCPDLQVLVFESVAQAGRLGAPLMRKLRARLEERTGALWDLHHVFHNNLSVGGTCNRPRYFFVASRVPFGVLPATSRSAPPTSVEVLRSWELGADGNHTPGTMEARRTASLLGAGVLMEARETISQPAGRFAERYGLDELRKLDGWDSRRLDYFAGRGFRPDQYQPRRMAADVPAGVLTGKIQETISPTEPRCLTFREAARVLGYPESWKLAHYETDAWLGKGIPVGSGRWIAESVRLSLEGRANDLREGSPVGEREWLHDNTNEWKRPA